MKEAKLFNGVGNLRNITYIGWMCRLSHNLIFKQSPDEIKAKQ